MTARPALIPSSVALLALLVCMGGALVTAAAEEPPIDLPQQKIFTILDEDRRDIFIDLVLLDRLQREQAATGTRTEGLAGRNAKQNKKATGFDRDAFLKVPGLIAADRFSLARDRLRRAEAFLVEPQEGGITASDQAERDRIRSRLRQWWPMLAARERYVAARTAFDELDLRIEGILLADTDRGAIRDLALIAGLPRALAVGEGREQWTITGITGGQVQFRFTHDGIVHSFSRQLGER